MDYSALALELMQKSNAFRKTHMQERAAGLIKGEFFMLNVLKDAPKPMQPRDLSDELQVSTARIAAMLNSLEKKGYIQREMDASDRRKIIVSLTPVGLHFANHHLADMQCNLAKLLEQMGEVDAKEYVRLVGKILEIVSTSNDLKESVHD